MKTSWIFYSMVIFVAGISSFLVWSGIQQLSIQSSPNKPVYAFSGEKTIELPSVHIMNKKYQGVEFMALVRQCDVDLAIAQYKQPTNQPTKTCEIASIYMDYFRSDEFKGW